MTEQLSFATCVAIYEDRIHAGALVRPELLESAVMEPYQTFDGEELYPTLAAKAGRLAFGIAQAQAFEDGNKRLAWYSSLVLLEANGAGIEATEQEAADAIRGVCEHRLNREGLVEWYQCHIVFE